MKVRVANPNKEDTRIRMQQYKARLDPKILDELRYTIPLNSTALFDATTPLEFQCLLQDLFFLTPGVNELLFEGVNDDDEYNNDNED